MLASEMSAGEILALAQEVREMRPRLDLGVDEQAIDGERDGSHAGEAWLTARLSAVT
jgi:hypothetical protein